MASKRQRERKRVQRWMHAHRIDQRQTSCQKAGRWPTAEHLARDVTRFLTQDTGLGRRRLTN